MLILLIFLGAVQGSGNLYNTFQIYLYTQVLPYETKLSGSFINIVLVIMYTYIIIILAASSWGYVEPEGNKNSNDIVSLVQI